MWKHNPLEPPSLRQKDADAWGVYAIVNKMTAQLYVGATGRSFYARWKQHLRLLRVGKHSNKGLQQDWKTYGSDAFEFRILEVVDDYKYLGGREWYWQQTYNGIRY